MPAWGGRSWLPQRTQLYSRAGLLARQLYGAGEVREPRHLNSCSLAGWTVRCSCHPRSPGNLLIPGPGRNDADRPLFTLLPIYLRFSLPNRRMRRNTGRPREEGATVALRKRVFVSYVREDSGSVDRLVAGLEAGGFDVWLDRTHLIPGMHWKTVIRKEIRSGDYFIACFSPQYISKSETYMNEEINLAIERLRMMNKSRRWFIPIKLGECE